MINYKKERSIELGIRFWFVGAIMYFIGWTISTDPLDQFAGLTIAITIVNIAMVNPIISQVTNHKEHETRRYDQIPIQEKLLKRTKEFFETMLIMIFIIYVCYKILNVAFGWIGTEPFSFGLFYVIGFVLLENIKKGFNKIRKK